jgi:hypothetical protein
MPFYKSTPSKTPHYALHRDFDHLRREFKFTETKSTIYTCDCGNRYLKTRLGQQQCLPCVVNTPQFGNRQARAHNKGAYAHPSKGVGVPGKRRHAYG